MGLFGPPNVKRLEEKGDVPGLIEALGYEKDVGVRTAAAEALGRAGDPLAVEPLFAVVRDRRLPDACREAAAEALGQIGAPAVESLGAVLEGPNPESREAAARVLGKIGEPAIESLGIALKDSSADVRAAAAKALGAIGGPRAVEALSPAFTDASAGVRQTAAKALAKTGWIPGSGETGEAYRLVEKRDWAECVKLGAPAVDPLVATLKRRDWRVRRAAAETLGKIADPRAAKALVAALGDTDQHVREAAADALVKIMAPAAQPLAAALMDGNATRRRLAMETLDRTGWSPDNSAAGASYWIAKGRWSRCVEIGAPAVKPLIWALENDDEYGRAEAALALGRIGSKRAVEPLCACLKDGVVGVRQAAAEALGKTRDPRAVGPLVAALGDPDVLMRQAAAEALGKIGDPALGPLIGALGDTDRLLRQAAAEALGKTRDPRAVQPLIAALKDGERPVRQSAADALCEIGAGAVQPLIAALSDGEEHVRMHAARALVALYESGKLGREQKATILSQRGAIAGVHADHRAAHTDESTPSDRGHADLTHHEDEPVAFQP